MLKAVGVKREKGDSGVIYYEPDEEELEDERLDAAAKLIQGIFRVKCARHVIRELAKANFVKEIDSLSGEYVYRNRRTGRVSHRKPVFYGSDDIETPRIYTPSGKYDPGQSSLPQFALVITNWIFKSPKIPDIPAQVEGDHNALREVLEHPYFCKFLPENCFFFKNATLEVFESSVTSFAGQILATMKRLEKEWEARIKARRNERQAQALDRRLARCKAKVDQELGGETLETFREEEVENPEKASEDIDTETDMATVEEEFDPKEALLFVYICTHSAEITNSRGISGSYLVTSDTSWKSKCEVAKTAIRLEAFADVIARIQVRHKIMFFDVVHTAKESAGFKTRHLYPPRDMYDNAARLSGAVIVGSCRIGGTRELNLGVLQKETESFWAVENANNGKDGSRVEGHNRTNGAGFNRNASLEHSDDKGGSGDDSASQNDSDSSVGSTTDYCGSNKTSDGDARVPQVSKSGLEHGICSDWVRRIRNGWERFAARGDQQFLIAASGCDDVKDEAQRCYWRRRPSGTELTYVTGGEGGELRRDDAMQACVPVYDRALYGEETSVFGQSVRDSLSGECIEGSGTTRARVLMVHLYSFVVRRLESFERATSRTLTLEESRDNADMGTASRRKRAAKEVNKKKAQRFGGFEIRGARDPRELEKLKGMEISEGSRGTQAPVITGPSVSVITRATVCAAPSPPPPPEIPFAVEVTRDSVRMAWENSVNFAGAPPISYELEQRGHLRNNGTWTPVFPPHYPFLTSKFIRISHRVPGIGLQYRVRARNRGGWGTFSNPTKTITTKPWLACSSEGGAMARAMRTLARAGGARLVLERMRRYSSSLLTQENGFHQLAAEFNKSGGIKRTSLAQDVATVVADAMTVFSQDRKIQASGLLLLGWAARGKGGGCPMPQYLVERCLELVAAAEKLHFMDVTVKGNALWARSNLNSTKGGAVAHHCASSEVSWADNTTLVEESGVALVEDTAH